MIPYEAQQKLPALHINRHSADMQRHKFIEILSPPAVFVKQRLPANSLISTN
jgi:hypothetical protein